MAYHDDSTWYPHDQAGNIRVRDPDSLNRFNEMPFFKYRIKIAGYIKHVRIIGSKCEFNDPHVAEVRHKLSWPTSDTVIKQCELG